MNARWRWCLSAIIFILTVCGVVNQQQISVPNQEIVLQFTDVDLTTEQAKNTIATVKKQLKAIGVENIKVKEGENGVLKITYYSNFDVASIQSTLSKERTLTLDYSTLNKNQESSKLPIEDETIAYNLDVYEIHDANDSFSGLDGKVVLEPKPKNDRLYSPTFDVAFNSTNVKGEASLIKVAYRVSQHISLEIEEALHIIPEVRAGPIS